ncbi:hypothetical protein [Novosphingopyxis sp.]|uniref:hypothetical protein n=1 Tax=Novosphingopyxis sp. TaxID=2709690 RepID=UPI003B5B5077
MTDNELDEQWERCARHEDGENWACADHCQFKELRRIKPHALFQRRKGEFGWRLIDGQG